jgi:hypothetical protein
MAKQRRENAWTGFRELDDFGGRPGGFGNVYKHVIKGYESSPRYHIIVDSNLAVVSGDTYQSAIDKYYSGAERPASPAREAEYVTEGSKPRMQRGQPVSVAYYDLGPVPPKSNIPYVEPLLPPMAVAGSPLQQTTVKSVLIKPAVVTPAPTVVVKPAVVAQAPAVKAVVTVNWWDQLMADIKRAFGVK